MIDEQTPGTIRYWRRWLPMFAHVGARTFLRGIRQQDRQLVADGVYCAQLAIGLLHAEGGTRRPSPYPQPSERAPALALRPGYRVWRGRP